MTTQFAPTEVNSAEGTDGFGSCETVGFREEEEKPFYMTNNAKYLMGFGVFCVVAMYASGSFTDASQKLDPRLSTPGGSASLPAPTTEQLKASRNRLAKISKKVTRSRNRRSAPPAHQRTDQRECSQMRERGLEMKAQLAKMKKRDRDLRDREEAVEEKLAQARIPQFDARAAEQQLLQANKKLDSAASSSSHKLKLMSMNAAKKALEAENQSLVEELNKEKLRSERERAQRLARASKGDVLKAQQEAAIEAKENREVSHRASPHYWVCAQPFRYC